ncbi:unnamed protein product [Rhizophagus irregularis]|nr:unnamed protein product [Rhizophagus irregularis]
MEEEERIEDKDRDEDENEDQNEDKDKDENEGEDKDEVDDEYEEKEAEEENGSFEEIHDKSGDETDEDNEYNNENDKDKKSNKERSFVLFHFEKLIDVHGVKNSKTGGSMGNLSKHLKNHLDKIDPSIQKQAEFMKKFLTKDDNEKIPFSNEKFREKINKLCNEKAVLPSADTVRNDVLKLYKNYQTDVKYKLQNIPVQEILRYIKADDAQEEDEILELILQEERENHFNVKIIPRLRRLIVKLRFSPQWKEKFARHCEFYSKSTTNLILDVRTRWNSTFFMLDRALNLRDPIDDISLLESELNKFLISNEEWNIVKELHRVLEKFYKATEYMSTSKYVTLSSSVPIYNKLLDHIEGLLDNDDAKYCKISIIREAIRKGYEKLRTYYTKTDDSDAYTIATILDPRLKLNFYIKEKWEPEFVDQAKNIFTNTYNNNYFKMNNDVINDDHDHDKDDFFYEIFGVDNNTSDNLEIEEYLKKPVEHMKTNPLVWWKGLSRHTRNKCSY